jgi:hypothetical protein
VGEPILASTITGGTGPQSFDLTILDHFMAYAFPAGPPSNVDEDLLQRMITSASVAIQSWLGYDVHSGSQLAVTSYTEALDSVYDGAGWPNQWVYSIPVTWSPIISVASVTLDNISVPSGGDPVKTPGFFIDSIPAKARQIFVAGYRPIARGRKNVVVTYTGGYAAIPYDVEQACIETVALRYKRKDNINVRTLSMAGETTSFVTADIPDSARMALQPYRRVTLG